MRDDRSKDSIAEPLYGLINEVYELHGMFKWARKSFIAFVEVTFGRSINRYGKSHSITSSLRQACTKFEPPHGKINNLVFEQVRHKPSCTSNEDG